MIVLEKEDNLSLVYGKQISCNITCEIIEKHDLKIVLHNNSKRFLSISGLDYIKKFAEADNCVKVNNYMNGTMKIVFKKIENSNCDVCGEKGDEIIISKGYNTDKHRFKAHKKCIEDLYDFYQNFSYDTSHYMNKENLKFVYNKDNNCMMCNNSEKFGFLIGEHNFICLSHYNELQKKISPPYEVTSSISPVCDICKHTGVIEGEIKFENKTIKFHEECISSIKNNIHNTNKEDLEESIVIDSLFL